MQEVFGEADAVVFVPFFGQGGRVTVEDVHYVVQGHGQDRVEGQSKDKDKDGDDGDDGGRLVPVGSTPFARDVEVGFSGSNLRDYILEKIGKMNKREEKGKEQEVQVQVHSITLEDIRIGGPEGVYKKLLSVPKGGIVIVNAVAESDINVSVAGLLLGEYSIQDLLN